MSFGDNPAGARPVGAASIVGGRHRVDTHSTLSAAGTILRPSAITCPTPARRLRLIAEIGLLFVAAPLVLKFVVFSLKVPLFIALPPLLAGLLAFLLWDRTFRVRAELAQGIGLAELASIFGIFVVAGCAITALVAWQLPQNFLSMPLERPHIWQRVMLFYPLASVVPQELIYRSFFFHRYGPLFGNARHMAIVTNGVLFGFAHVIFGSLVAVALTTLLGLLLAWRYLRTRSLLAVWLEHALYGCLAFTIGIGFLFFTGIASIG